MAGLRQLLAGLDGADAATIAPRLLGGVLSVVGADGALVRLRLTEVEAYGGAGVDPGAHSFRGPTRRNATMFGPPGHLYVYFTYGMHVCANIVVGAEGVGTGVLLRAGEVVEGLEAARARRLGARDDSELARGPARLTRALGIVLGDDGARIGQAPPDRFGFQVAPVPPQRIANGPRTGVSGPGGSDAFPWRFWLVGDPTVSPYRAHRPRAR